MTVAAEPLTNNNKRSEGDQPFPFPPGGGGLLSRVEVLEKAVLKLCGAVRLLSERLDDGRQESVDDLKRRALLDALRATNRNKMAAARRLKLNIKTLYNWCELYAPDLIEKQRGKEFLESLR